MNRSIIPQALAISLFANACSPSVPGNFVLVEGGGFKNTKSVYYGHPTTISDFYIGKYEVTQKEWQEVMAANANGYRLPTAAEWEYAAGGGQLSNSYTYSGSNELDKIAWYWKNAGDNYLTGVGS